jgi:hypothetical protein
LPLAPNPYFVFLKILTDRKQLAPANELWHALTSQNLKFPAEKAFPYFDYLITTQQIDQAEDVWRFLGDKTTMSSFRITPPISLPMEGTRKDI